jgi:hypothetical protein
MKRRKSRDAYYDDEIVADGEVVRTRMTMADAAMVSGIHAKYPRGGYHYGRGFVRDSASGLIVDARAPATSPIVRGAGNAAPSKSSDPERNDWPTSNSGNFPIWGYSPGQSCKTVEGKPGKLCPHPSNSSILVCMPDDSKDAATVMDATTAYYAMVDAAKDEWRRYGPRPLHDCGCGGRTHDQEGTVGFLNTNQVQWPQGQHAGQRCTVNGAAGHIEKHGDQFVCIPDGRDQAPSNIAPSTAPVGGPWAQGGECDLGNGEIGRLVKQGDRLICKPCEIDMDSAQAKRDAAYWQSVRDAESEWRCHR